MVVVSISFGNTLASVPDIAEQHLQLVLLEGGKLNNRQGPKLKPDLLISKQVKYEYGFKKETFVDIGLPVTNLAASDTFALIPAGPFQMGDTLGEGSNDENPVHTVNLSDFLIGKREVTKALWDEVRAWGIPRGYTDLPVGRGKAPDHPVSGVSWFHVIKWSNAQSEKEGLSPVYRVKGAVMRTGETEPTVNSEANGYRLPTEAEWEKAARGGLIGKRFPWGDTISHSHANYGSYRVYDYDVNAARGYHPGYESGANPYTSPVGSFSPNGYGVYDMTGNVWEWCWDWFGSSYATGVEKDPQGAISGLFRVLRGGSWYDHAFHCRVTNRYWDDPLDRNNGLGFRSARGCQPKTSSHE